MGYKMENIAKYDIVFEILHYMAVESTILSIEYIEKNIDTDSYRIVVVDNCSPDGSGERLADKYSDSEKVEILLNSSNQGFTRGNNYGIRYIRDHYDCCFLAVMNNDVLLAETTLIHKLNKYYAEYGFAVAGPNVVDPYGSVSNPVAYELPSDKLISERIEGPVKLLKFDKYGLINVYDKIAYTSFRIQRFFKGEAKKKYILDAKQDVVLHGCFWVFSRKYFERYSGLADKEYMYGEEETLQLCLEKAGLKSIYMPDVTVLHLHAQSSKEAFGNKAEKKRFVAHNQIESWKEYLKLREELEK
ncbi:MAG: glycosyltransferase [Lachnospiraceae bacterium]|nr:glycosyltransferase [Lachnospiraceae bacterium]